jgi:hypothetical protein
MLNNENPIEILTKAEWLELAEEKIEARQQLLKLPPKEAQAIVDRVMIPSFWKPIFRYGSNFNSLSLTNDDDDNDDDESKVDPSYYP